MNQASLRERSKERRRRAIQLAGLRLFAAQGYDNTSVAEIAAAAEVSTRSVSAYYPAKLNIATASSDAAADRLAAAISAKPPDKTVVDVFMEWMEGEPEYVEEEEWHLRATMLASNPIIASTGTPHTVALVTVASRAIAEDLDASTDAPVVQMLLGILAGVVLQHQVAASGHHAYAETVCAARAALSGAFEKLLSLSEKTGDEVALDANEPEATA